MRKSTFLREKEKKKSGDIITVHPIPGHAPRLRAADSGVGVGVLTLQDALAIPGNLTIYLPRLTWVGTTLESTMHMYASRLTFKDVQFEPVDAHLILLHPVILSSGTSVDSNKSKHDLSSAETCLLPRCCLRFPSLYFYFYPRDY